MSEEWRFWKAQLAGETPETTPGTPHAGFYILRRRWTRENDDPNRRPGDPRKKVTTEDLPVAIWLDGSWHMVIGKEEYYRDVDRIDDTFSRCCRNAIDHETYERMRHEHEDQ
jgi:hypothetical protein